MHNFTRALDIRWSTILYKDEKKFVLGEDDEKLLELREGGRDGQTRQTTCSFVPDPSECPRKQGGDLLVCCVCKDSLLDVYRER